MAKRILQHGGSASHQEAARAAPGAPGPAASSTELVAAAKEVAAEFLGAPGAPPPEPATGPAATIPGQSQEFQQLVEMVLEGQLSAQTSRVIANTSCRDGPRHAEMQFLGRIGGHSSVRHAWRDLKKRLQLDDSVFPEGEEVMIPVKDLKARPVKVVWVPWRVLLLQDLCHSLWHNNRDEFFRRFVGGDPGKIAKFWAEAKPDDPRLRAIYI